MEQYRLGERTLAIMLSMIAGFIDSLGFMYLGGVFLSFMSGNTTRFATAYVEKNWELVILAGSCIALFLVGVINGAATHRLASRRWGLYRAREAVMMNVAILAAISSILVLFHQDSIAVLGLSIIVGTMNSVFEKNGEVAVPLTYTTGTLVKMGQRFTDTFFGGSHAKWLYHLSLWLSLAFGSILGALAFFLWNMRSVILVSVVIVIIAVLQQVIRNQRRHRGLQL